MSTEYYTTATASEGFWESLISDQFESEFPITYIGEGAGFTIKSVDYPAIKDMIELSKEHPDERFNVAVTTNDKLRDVIEYYEFQSGETFFNHVEPLYHFDVSEEVDQEAGSEIINEFKKEITESLNWFLDFVPSYEQLLGCQNRSDEMVSNFQFEYGHKDITLNARLIGHTCIEIDLEEKNNCNKNQKNMSIVYQTVVTVPKDFIEKELENIFNWKFGLSANLENNCFTFWAKNYPDPGLDQIIDYSERYPDLVFEAESTCEMELDQSEIHTISNGEIINQQKHTWFKFIYNAEIKSVLADESVLQFEEEARRYFNLIDNYLRRKYGNGCFHELHIPKFNSMEFFYSTDDATLIARRKDLKTLEVEIELTRHEEPELANENMEDLYKDVPF